MGFVMTNNLYYLKRDDPLLKEFLRFRCIRHTSKLLQASEARYRCRTLSASQSAEGVRTYARAEDSPAFSHEGLVVDDAGSVTALAAAEPGRASGACVQDGVMSHVADSCV